MHQQNFFWPHPLGPGEKSKGQLHLISITKSISKIFIQNFVFVLTNERYKTYQTGFQFCYLGHAPGLDLGALGMPRGSIFFEHGHVAYQIDGDDKKKTMKLHFSTYGQTGDLRMRSKGQISINFG